ncbi:MAG: IS66 family insertion sequence element accessory protein TnpB [Bradyrhizobium sp.]|nr:IS66 family insertion sequence element accessory protein TnpB [Bradyrhizobium sp.]
MDVQIDLSTAGYGGRLEVLEGPTGRRVRSDAEKARIAAESLLPGGVAAVVRKHGATRWQVYDWPRQGQLALPESVAASFAPLMVDATSTPARASKAAPAKVEIVIGDMVIRTAVDVELLSEVKRLRR